MIQVKSESYENTKKIGCIFGRVLEKGDALCLYGEMGSGKTAFTGGVANGLGISDRIASPTFSIINEYDGPVPLYHFDVYRISNEDELFEIGYYDYIFSNGVTVIEWAQNIKEQLPDNRFDIYFNAVDENTRIIKIFGIGNMQNKMSVLKKTFIEKDIEIYAL